MIISVWGSPASGKTTLATKLGITLDKKNKNTVIIYTENLAVDIAAIYPNEKDFVSMGDLWQQEIEEEEIYKLCMTVAGKNNLAYMSYMPRENIYSYPLFAKYNVVKAITSLHELYDYIIFDCSSDISSNMITQVALEMSDVVYRLCGTTLKASCFFDSNLSLLSDSRFNIDGHINVLANARAFEPISIYKNKYGNMKYELDFDNTIYQQSLKGELPELNKSKYQKNVEKMVRTDILLDYSFENKEDKKSDKGKEKGFFSFGKKKKKVKEIYDE